MLHKHTHVFIVYIYTHTHTRTLLTAYARTGWRRCIGCLKFQVSFWKRATIYLALSREMAYKDMASSVSLPSVGGCVCIGDLQIQTIFLCIQYAYMYIYIYMYICTQENMFGLVIGKMEMLLHFKHICLCMYICVYVYIHIYIYTYIHIYINIYLYAYTYVQI